MSKKCIYTLHNTSLFHKYHMLWACWLLLGHVSINLVQMYRNSQIRTYKNKTWRWKASVSTFQLLPLQFHQYRSLLILKCITGRRKNFVTARHTIFIHPWHYIGIQYVSDSRYWKLHPFHVFSNIPILWNARIGRNNI